MSQPAKRARPRVPGLSAVLDHGRERPKKASGDPLADALLEVAAAIREATEQRKGADEFFENASTRLDHVCAWLKKWAPRVMWSAPGILVAIGAIAPNVGDALRRIIAALSGVGAG